ncbi:MAG: glycosyl transferase family protein [Cellvibrionales bacterium]|nr:glycosyl transferase family protein [Cellvibrionales bacterium]
MHSNSRQRQKGARSLTRKEAQAAFGMILRGEAEPMQIGAFLMLLRVKEENAEELAGFIAAARTHIAAPRDIAVDLDWSSCAGKRKHLPWFILSALLLAENGIRIFMHGTDGHKTNRIYTEHCFHALGLPVAKNWQDVSSAIDANNLCFFPLRAWGEPLQQLADLRDVLGLRSTVHTVTRMTNPLNALCSVQGIFHPPYAENCAQANYLLEQTNALTIKGDSGEFEYRPEADCKLFLLNDGQRDARTVAAFLRRQTRARNHHGCCAFAPHLARHRYRRLRRSRCNWHRSTRPARHEP